MRNTGIFAALASRAGVRRLILAWREEYGVDSPCDEILDVGELRSLPLRVRHQEIVSFLRLAASS